MARHLPILCLAALLSARLPVQAQDNAGATHVPRIASYRISVTLAGTSEDCLYLKGYEGEAAYVADSARVRNGKAVFKNRQALPCGVYSITDSRDSVLTDIILNRSSRFSVMSRGAGRQAGLTCDGSDENAVLFAFRKRLSQLPEDAPDALGRLLREYTETAPQSFVSRYVKARYSILGFLQYHDNHLITAAQLDTLVRSTHFGEPRLLHSPLPVYSLMCHYLTDQGIYHTDSLLAVVDGVMKRCTDPDVRDFYLGYFFHLFDQHNPDYDPILVHLYDDFDRSWISGEYAPWYKRKVDRIRRILPGARLPLVYSHDIDGHMHSVNELKSKYTVLWFWDPDCDHCLTETPRLHELFQEYGDKYDFRVFAVEVNGDYERWKDFSDEHRLWDWTNLTVAKGEPSHDFFDYFDIMTTPVMFLVDNTQNHTIIARQWTLEELMEYFEQKHK